MKIRAVSCWGAAPFSFSSQHSRWNCHWKCTTEAKVYLPYSSAGSSVCCAVSWRFPLTLRGKDWLFVNLWHLLQLSVVRRVESKLNCWKNCSTEQTVLVSILGDAAHRLWLEASGGDLQRGRAQPWPCITRWTGRWWSILTKLTSTALAVLVCHEESLHYFIFFS